MYTMAFKTTQLFALYKGHCCAEPKYVGSKTYLGLQNYIGWTYDLVLSRIERQKFHEYYTIPLVP